MILAKLAKNATSRYQITKFLSLTLAQVGISHCFNLGHLIAYLRLSISRSSVYTPEHYAKDVVSTAIYGLALISYYRR